MGRSLTRFTLLIGSAIAGGSLLAGCATEIPGPAVIGAPAAVATSASQPVGNFLTSLEQAVSSELSAINSTQSDTEPPQVLVELEALSSNSSLTEAENFGSLVTTGANQIAKRERLLNALIASVKSSVYLSGVTVNGTSLSVSILALLNNVNSQVQSQAASLEAAALPDQLRAVVTAIGPSTRVFGLVQPVVHLALAAGDELNGAALLENQWVILSRQAYQHHGGSYANQYATELQALNALKADIDAVTSTATRDIETVLGLTPAGYPGNQATIVSVRAQLVQLKSGLGPLNAGAGEITAITTDLSQLP
jgi:hypothetical protein